MWTPDWYSMALNGEWGMVLICDTASWLRLSIALQIIGIITDTDK